MIVLKTSRELSIMRKAGKISQTALRLAGEAVEPGTSTWELDKIVHKYITSMGATPSFLHYQGFPGSACISVNEVVIHGIPKKETLLKKGDIVSIDVGACYKGFHGDNAWTFPCGEVSEEAQALLTATRESLFEGIKMARPGNRLGDIGHTVQAYVEARNYSVVRELRHPRPGGAAAGRHDHRHRAHGKRGPQRDRGIERRLDHRDKGPLFGGAL